jgi:hypothetical protein
MITHARGCAIGALVPLLTIALAGCGSATPSASSPAASTVSSPSPTVPPSALASAPPSTASAPPSTASGEPSPSASVVPSLGPGASIDPANFTTTVDNPWFPLIPGTVFTYKGLEGGKPATDVYTVTSKTKVLDGVRTVVVDDRLYHGSVLSERTSDYYVQDVAGNVWYFGEDTAELDRNGHVKNTEGTWHAGVDGAEPGIYMEADPVVGHQFAQESYPGQAEDMFRVAALDQHLTVPYGSFTGVLMTREWTPLEPGVLDHKFYAKGVGEIRERTVKGGNDSLDLVSVKTP